MDPGQTKFSRRPALDGLRGLAVGAVVLFHASTPGFAAGYLGVDVFFVLSGFLITSLLLVELGNWEGGSGGIDLWRFYSRRARRLLPAASLVLLCTAGAYRLALDPLSVTRSRGSFVSAVCYVANWAFIAADGNYWAEGRLVSPVKHYWSLSVEEQFYYVYPVCIAVLVWLCRRGNGSVRQVPLAGAMLGVFLASASTAMWLFVQGEVTASYMSTLARLYQLVGGGMVAVVAPYVSLPPYVSTLGLVGLVGVLLSCDVMSSLLGGFASFAAACVVILGLEGLKEEAAQERSWSLAMLASKGLTFVGGCSYSIYLVHFPIVVIGDDCGWLLAKDQPAARTAVVAVMSLALGYVCKTVVEQSFSKVSLSTGARKKMAVACIVLVPLVTVGLLSAILSPSMFHAHLLPAAEHHDEEHHDVAYTFVPELPASAAEEEAEAPNLRVVSMGDSHCLVAESLMRSFYRERGIHGRSLCQGSAPVFIYPKEGEKDAKYRVSMVDALEEEPTDYLVVWNVRVQMACYFAGVACLVDSPFNSDKMAEKYNDEFEPAILAYFAPLLKNVEVAIVLMLPELVAPKDPLTCLFGHENWHDCDWDGYHIPGHEQVLAAYGALAAAAKAAGGPEVLMVSTDELLCPGGRCEAVRAELPFFVDRNHVNEEVWTGLLPEVEELWQAAGMVLPAMADEEDRDSPK